MRTWQLLTIVFLSTSYNHPETLYKASLPEVIVTAKREVPLQLRKEWLLLARLVAAESGNQPFDGQHAVADVVLHTANDKGWSITRTIYDKGRFDGIYSKNFFREPSESCKEAARLAILGKHILPENVLYFHNPVISTDTKWVQYISQFAYKQIGDHLFCYKP